MQPDGVSDSPRRIGFVDGVRAIASVAVLAQHLLERIDPERFRPVLMLGPGVFGVVLFFFVSGYVIPLSVRNNPTLPEFLLRRWFRIYPAYLLALVVSIATLSAFGIRPLGSYSPADLVTNLLLVSEYVGRDYILGVAWTLPLEFAWYALFAALFYRLGEERIVPLAQVYVGSIVVLSALSAAVGVRLPLGRVCMIGAAIIGYLAFEQASNQLDGRTFWRIASAFAASAALGAFVSYGVNQHPSISLFNALSAWILAIASFYVLIGSATLRQHALVSSGPMQWLGWVSYSLYLVHGIVLNVVGRFDLGYWALVVAPAVSLALSAVSYRLVEKPAISAGRRLERDLISRLRWPSPVIR